MSLKENITHALDTIHQLILDYAAQATPEIEAQTGTPEHWAPKDVLGHLSYWRGYTIRCLQAARRGEPIPEEGELDEVNQDVFERYKDQPWRDVLAELVRNYLVLVAILETFDESLLDQRDERGTPFWRRVLGIECLHPLLHLCDLYHQADDHARALQVWEQGMEALAQITQDPKWHGTLQYNLACQQLFAGEREQATQTLAKAFSLRPSLRKWAEQDPDMDLLRGDATFTSLLKGSQDQSESVD